MQSVAIMKNIYLYKGNEYNTFNIDTLIKKLGRKRNIIILSEQLFIKKYDIEEKTNIERFIDNKILEDFSNKDDLLFHYEYVKKYNCVYLYSIRCIGLNRFYSNIESLTVKPIQFLIKDLILKTKNKFKSFIAIYKLKELYYVVDINEEIIINSYILNKEEEVKEIIQEINKTIVIDNNLKELDLIKEKVYINIGDKINERLFIK